MHGEIRLFNIHSKSTITAHSIEIEEMLPSPKQEYIINKVYSEKEEKIRNIRDETRLTRRDEKWGRDSVTPKLHDCRESGW